MTAGRSHAMVRDIVAKRILACEALGFCAVIVLLWVNELVDLPHLVFRTEATPMNWVECLVESIAVAFLGFLVFVSSDMLLSRIRYLEGFLPVCRYCRKIRVGDEWMSFESYVKEYEEDASTHGLCPECSRRRQIIKEDLATEGESDE
jgi:hypothetical protein